MFSFFLMMALITTRFFAVQAQTEMVENGGAKDFIVTWIFLRIITVSIKIINRIFSISFTESKFNETWKTIITLILKLCSLFTSSIYQPKIKFKDGYSYFYKNQSYRPLEIEKKKFFFSYFNSEFPNLSICVFSENAQCFIGAFL